MEKNTYAKGTAEPNWQANDDWFSESFDWKSYFGYFPIVKDQVQLINELNRFAIHPKI